jgi:hypothetical protein
MVDAATALYQAEAARQAYRAEHDGDLAAIDTTNVVELRNRHPELFDDRSPAELADCYSRQADELAALMEQWEAAAQRQGEVMRTALGELHVALDELSAQLAAPAAGGAQ